MTSRVSIVPAQRAKLHPTFFCSPGIALERQIQEQLRGSAMRLIGPNCLGVMNPIIGMNATFAKDAPKAGNVAFLSQRAGRCSRPFWI
jgi:acyl-CoA synthetase (NDP forming)